MNKLNPFASIINLAGTTVLLNSLLNTPAWGANLNVGDSINFDVIIRNQQVGNVKINVGEYIQGKYKGRRDPPLVPAPHPAPVLVPVLAVEVDALPTLLKRLLTADCYPLTLIAFAIALPLPQLMLHLL